MQGGSALAEPLAQGFELAGQRHQLGQAHWPLSSTQCGMRSAWSARPSPWA